MKPLDRNISLGGLPLPVSDRMRPSSLTLRAEINAGACKSTLIDSLVKSPEVTFQNRAPKQSPRRPYHPIPESRQLPSIHAILTVPQDPVPRTPKAKRGTSSSASLSFGPSARVSGSTGTSAFQGPTISQRCLIQKMIRKYARKNASQSIKCISSGYIRAPVGQSSVDATKGGFP